MDADPGAAQGSPRRDEALKKSIKSLEHAINELTVLKARLEALDAKRLSEQQIQELRENTTELCLLVHNHIQEMNDKERR